ncbi:MAG TPA: hypothetical protein VMU51_15145 [Mycobacteriales bacterium]|nr:hypothetical protein [Mycobacteriales bacterium]
MIHCRSLTAGLILAAANTFFIPLQDPPAPGPDRTGSVLAGSVTAGSVTAGGRPAPLRTADDPPVPTDPTVGSGSTLGTG